MANIAKQKQIALAVSAVLGGLSFMPAAQAVNLATDGLGQALHWSYYSVNGGNSTLFNIINTSDETVAGRLRFRESRNSRDVYDIVVVLSPHDYWNGIVEADPTYGASIRTTDTDTCTIPALNTPIRRAFKTTDLTDGGPNGVDRLKEGYFEFIQMGSAPGEMSCATATTLFTENSTSIGGAVALARVKAAFPDYVANPLKGVANIINVAGWNTAFQPVVFANFFAPGAAPNNNLISLHLPPTFQNIPIDDAETRFRASWYEPTLASTNTAAQVLTADGVLHTSNGTNASGANAISYLLSRTDVINTWSERLMSEGAAWDTSTALVLTLPTKGFYVDRLPATNMAASGNQYLVGLPNVGINGAPIPAQFTAPWSWSPTTGPGSCDPIRISLYDREENLYDDPPVTSPWGQGYEICNEANVITFRGGNPLFSNNPYNVDFTLADFPADAGWIDINLNSPANKWNARDDVGYAGLPVTGFGYTYRDQGTAAGVRDSVSYEHAYKRNLHNPIQP
jgi:hypothetical protein